MFEFEVNEAFIMEQQQALEQALSTNPKTQEAIRKIIRKYILEARKEVVYGIQFENGDPRGAAKAVRTAVYKKILGANMNIYNSRKAHGKNAYEPPRTLQPGQRGGNRRLRSPKTQRMMDYAPLDRGMILRWVNAGTSDRTTKYGSRGAIQPPRNFFSTLGDRAFGRMHDTLEKVFEEELAKILSGK